jgi:hypothetical protein
MTKTVPTTFFMWEQNPPRRTGRAPPAVPVELREQPMIYVCTFMVAMTNRTQRKRDASRRNGEAANVGGFGV